MPTKKTTKSKNRMTTKNFMADDKAEAEVKAAVEEDEPKVEVASVEGEEEDSKPEKPLKVAGKKKTSPNTKQFEMVTITVFEDMTPPPVIGKYDFRREKRVSTLTKGKHEVPFFVAEVLIDKGKATM